METNGEEDSGSEVAELRMKVESLKQELKTCRTELVKLQKQLTNSDRLQKSTESYNEDLRKQVDKLSAEIHEWKKKKDKDKANVETQTEEYTWTETDYYNYYGGYYENAVGTDTQETAATCSHEATELTNVTAVKTEPETIAEASSDVSVVEHGGGDAAKPEDVAGGSIADMLRSTAEEAMTQTGFIFDETSGMYYDHSTGFYYDSASQLYYDNNTGMYYYYDAESGRYQFHSRIEVAAAQAGEETGEDKKSTEKKGNRRKGVEKSSRQDKKDLRVDGMKVEEEEIEWVERRVAKRGATTSHRLRQRSCSPDLSSRRKSSSKSRRDGSSDQPVKRKKRRNGSCSDDASSSKKKLKKSKKRSKSSGKKKKEEKKKKKKKKAAVRQSDDSDGSSTPEEGEITESEGEWKSTPSFSSFSSTSSSSSSSSPSRDSPESEMESQEVEEVWPPCVRVTVVRSPVLQTGTLFIITADSPGTIGREKDMDHAIRIPEMGVSKFHAEVYFDHVEQCYMLVDQGSQNGTVLNGNRILQPKTKCDPCALTHGDEVKMGETVLSFHIHSGTDTCDGCEPGQVMAHLSKHRREEAADPAPTKEDKEALRQKELKQMKVKYGLKSAEYEEAKALKNPRYKDRAESRRQTVGSEGVFQRNDAPASVHVEISEVNKGRKMLEKMGWKKGEGLGKDGAGMKDPIQLKIRKSQSGLGAGAAVSVDDASLTRTKTQKNWEKARERFADTCQPDLPTSKTGKSRSPNPWVKAEDTE